jgi:hypothetical protein
MTAVQHAFNSQFGMHSTADLACIQLDFAHVMTAVDFADPCL